MLLSPFVSNAGWLFYYNYYRDLRRSYSNASQWQISDLEQKENQLFKDFDFSTFDDLVVASLPRLGNQEKLLTTIYPGLLIGTGISHETGVSEELILGFSFDHTFGLPIIPGSSVKGVLRSAFIDHPEYVKETILEILELEADFEEENWLYKLEVEIFGLRPGELSNDTEVPDTEQDIFFDAIPHPGESFEDKLFGKDTITPHKHEFKDPIPLPFMKVLPGITFRFDFLLYDSEKVPGLNAGLKSDLFEQILKDLGVGAKTNVGYGQLLEPTKFQERYMNDQEIRSLEAKKAAKLAKYNEKKNEFQGILNSAIQIMKEQEKLEILNEIPEEYILKNAPDTGAKLTVFGRVLPLSDLDKEKIDKGKLKKRKRLEVFQEPGVNLDNKWDKRLYDLEDDTWVKAEIMTGRERQGDNVKIESILKIELIKK